MAVEADGFDPKNIDPLAGVWGVFIAPDGTVLGPGVPFGTEARLGFAIREGGRWKEIPSQIALEWQRQAELGGM